MLKNLTLKTKILKFNCCVKMNEKESMECKEKPPVVIMCEEHQLLEIKANKPCDFLFWSILNTIWCMPFCGIAAIIYSVKTRETFRHTKNKQLSGVYAQRALLFNLISLICGLVLIGFITALHLYNEFHQRRIINTTQDTNPFGSFDLDD